MELPKFWHVHWTYFICCGRILCKDGQCILIASQMGDNIKRKKSNNCSYLYLSFAIILERKNLKKWTTLRASGWTSPHRIKPDMRPTAPISLLNCLWDADLEVRPYSKKIFEMSLRWSLVKIGNYIMFWKTDLIFVIFSPQMYFWAQFFFTWNFAYMATFSTSHTCGEFQISPHL